MHSFVKSTWRVAFAFNDLAVQNQNKEFLKSMNDNMKQAKIVLQIIVILLM